VQYCARLLYGIYYNCFLSDLVYERLQLFDVYNVWNFMSVDNVTDDSAANVDFNQSFSKLRDVSLMSMLISLYLVYELPVYVPTV